MITELKPCSLGVPFCDHTIHSLQLGSPAPEAVREGSHATSHPHSSSSKEAQSRGECHTLGLKNKQPGRKRFSAV